MKRFCSFLGEHATDVINFEKKKMLPLTRDHCHLKVKYIGAAHSLCNLRLNVPNKFPVVFHKGSDYDGHFIKKS